MASIKLKGDTSGEITISAPAVAGTTTLELPATSSTLATQNALGVRNLIINGDMRIAQRGTSATGLGNGDTGLHTVDRWRFQESGAPTFEFTQTQDTDVPSGQGFSSSLKMSCTTAQGSLATDDMLRITQIIESQNLQHLKYGTSSAESVTVSLWVKSNKTGNYNVSLYNNDYISIIGNTITINSANTWEKKTITFVGDTGNVLDNDNGRGLWLWIALCSGTDYTGTDTSSWTDSTGIQTTLANGQTVNLADSTSNYINITGVQLEVGTEATPFEHRPYDMELARCMRYYEETDPDGRVGLHGYIKQTNTLGRVFWNWKVRKRAAPTLSVGFVTAGLFTLRYGDSGSRNCSDSQVTLGLSTIDCCTMEISISQTMLSGYGLTCDVRGDLSGNTRLIADAEL